jgi:5-methylcytosine-specific restriction enzyme A
MPRRAPRPCAVPGCPRLVREGSYCAEHLAERRRSQDARRGTAAQRGYGQHWRKIRARFLRKYPRCARCGAVATVAHHIKRVRDGGRHTEDNLMALCAACHSRLHAESGESFTPAAEGGKGR